MLMSTRIAKETAPPSHRDGLSEEELRTSLKNTFTKSGFLSSLKTQLRSELVNQLKTSHPSHSHQRCDYRNQLLSKEQAATTDSSLFTQALNSLIAEYLHSHGYSYTVSVFSAEGRVEERWLLTEEEDTLIVLGLNGNRTLKQKIQQRQTESRAQNLMEESTQSRSQSLLEMIIKEIASNPNPRELRTADMDFTAPDDSFRASIQIERRREISQMRLEEKRKFNEQIDKMRRHFEQTYRLRFEQLQRRVKQLSESMTRKERDIESVGFEQRQRVLDDLRELKQREVEFKRVSELQSQSIQAQQERLKEEEQILESRSLEFRHLRDQLESRIESEKSLARSEMEAKYLQREANIQRMTIELQQKLQKVDIEHISYAQTQRELALVQQKVTDLSRVGAINEDLGLNVERLKEVNCRLEKQKTYFEERFQKVEEGNRDLKNQLSNARAGECRKIERIKRGFSATMQKNREGWRNKEIEWFNGFQDLRSEIEQRVNENEKLHGQIDIQHLQIKSLERDLSTFHSKSSSQHHPSYSPSSPSPSPVKQDFLESSGLLSRNGKKDRSFKRQIFERQLFEVPTFIQRHRFKSDFDLNFSSDELKSFTSPKQPTIRERMRSGREKEESQILRPNEHFDKNFATRFRNLISLEEEDCCVQNEVRKYMKTIQNEERTGDAYRYDVPFRNPYHKRQFEQNLLERPEQTDQTQQCQIEQAEQKQLLLKVSVATQSSKKVHQQTMTDIEEQQTQQTQQQRERKSEANRQNLQVDECIQTEDLISLSNAIDNDEKVESPETENQGFPEIQVENQETEKQQLKDDQKARQEEELERKEREEIEEKGKKEAEKKRKDIERERKEKELKEQELKERERKEKEREERELKERELEEVEQQEKVEQEPMELQQKEEQEREKDQMGREIDHINEDKWERNLETEESDKRERQEREKRLLHIRQQARKKKREDAQNKEEEKEEKQNRSQMEEESLENRQMEQEASRNPDDEALLAVYRQKSLERRRLEEAPATENLRLGEPVVTEQLNTQTVGAPPVALLANSLASSEDETSDNYSSASFTIPSADEFWDEDSIY